jgi:hypothetical protein
MKLNYEDEDYLDDILSQFIIIVIAVFAHSIIPFILKI